MKLIRSIGEIKMTYSSWRSWRRRLRKPLHVSIIRFTAVIDNVCTFP
jgi:hypothetical protein